MKTPRLQVLVFAAIVLPVLVMAVKTMKQAQAEICNQMAKSVNCPDTTSPVSYSCDFYSGPSQDFAQHLICEWSSNSNLRVEVDKELEPFAEQNDPTGKNKVKQGAKILCYTVYECQYDWLDGTCNKGSGTPHTLETYVTVKCTTTGGG